MSDTLASAVEAMITRWNQKSILRVAVIDDAFDPPSARDYSAEQVRSFVAAVQADEAAEAEAQRLGCSINDADNMGALDAALRTLWEHRARLGALSVHCEALFLTADEKGEELKPLLESLKATLGRQVDCLGVGGAVTDLSTRLILIDYHLGPGPEGIDVAKSVAQAIATQYAGEDTKPLMILMSSKQVTPDMIDSFRRETGLIPGMFYFLAKADFGDTSKLLYKLDHFATAIPDAAKIQKLLDSLETALEDVSRAFMKNIKELSFGDYAYVQSLSLQDDGHPLGDYMLWLFHSHLGHLLARDARVRQQSKLLDKMTFHELPSGQAKPSLWLATIYRSALASEEDNDLIHPRTPEDAEHALPYLHLGDLFFKDVGSQLWLVVNAQCDLSFTPDRKQRLPKPDRSVFILPGSLQPLSKPLDEYDRQKPRTELFEWEGQAYRILWDTKRVRSIELGTVVAWQQREDYRRVARLRLPFALAIQQAFNHDMTRLGMPVAPPIYRPVRVELLCSGSDGKAVLLLDSEHCAVFLKGQGEKCCLDEDFIYGIPGKVGDALSLLQGRADFLTERGATPETLGKIQTQIERLDPFLNADRTFQALSLPFLISKSDGNDQLQSHPVCIRRNEQLVGRTYRFEQPLAINIIDSVVQEVTHE